MKIYKIIIVLFIPFFLWGCDMDFSLTVDYEPIQLRIQGTVMDASVDSPISDAQVTLYGVSSVWDPTPIHHLVTHLTDKQGLYSITHKTEMYGSFNLCAHKPGYTKYCYNFDDSISVIRVDYVQTFNFQLEKEDE